MTELEWMKQESGLTDDELKAWETVLGDAKFKGFLTKIMKAGEASGAARVKAETELQTFTDTYENKFLPAMRLVTQESVATAGEVASLRAKLAKAEEYGIVPEEKTPAMPTPRAPGSPDPNVMTRDDFGRFSQNQSNTLIALQDLNAEHFSLFGAPLGNTQELVDEAMRQRTLGNKNFTLKNAWEAKYNVSAKRAEVTAATQKKHDDEIREATRREERERKGANPNVRSGTISRFSTYRTSDAKADKPWQAARGKNERNADWRENARAKVLAGAAA